MNATKTLLRYIHLYTELYVNPCLKIDVRTSGALVILYGAYQGKSYMSSYTCLIIIIFNYRRKDDITFCRTFCKAHPIYTKERQSYVDGRGVVVGSGSILAYTC